MVSYTWQRFTHAVCHSDVAGGSGAEASASGHACPGLAHETDAIRRLRLQYNKQCFIRRRLNSRRVLPARAKRSAGVVGGGGRRQ
ncbi:MAG: hypothetical protein H6R12_692 [Proteobacteria bacterium]|nr:hypothetical protein [Pseudomonadota bacterium]